MTCSPSVESSRSACLDVCEEECDRGSVYVIGRVRNAGNLEAPAGIEVSLRAGGGGAIVASAVTTQITAPGATGELLAFTAVAADLAGQRPVVTADEDSFGYGVIYECDEGNNAGTWTETVCD